MTSRARSVVDRHKTKSKNWPRISKSNNLLSPSVFVFTTMLARTASQVMKFTWSGTRVKFCKESLFLKEAKRVSWRKIKANRNNYRKYGSKAFNGFAVSKSRQIEYLTVTSRLIERHTWSSGLWSQSAGLRSVAVTSPSSYWIESLIKAIWVKIDLHWPKSIFFWIIAFESVVHLSGSL